MALDKVTVTSEYLLVPDDLHSLFPLILTTLPPLSEVSIFHFTDKETEVQG